jgi:hypothetical protein
VATFDELTAALCRPILRLLRRDLPPQPWIDPTHLHWIGLNHTIGSARICLAWSFGRLRQPEDLFSRNLSTADYDYAGQVKVLSAFDDEAAASDLVHAVNDLGEEDEGRGLILLALGWIGLQIERDAATTPYPRAPTFHVTIADDHETPTWSAKLREAASLARLSTEDRATCFEGSSRAAGVARFLELAIARPELDWMDGVRGAFTE